MNPDEAAIRERAKAVADRQIRLARAAYSGHIWKQVGMSCTRYCELLAASGMKLRIGKRKGSRK